MQIIPAIDLYDNKVVRLYKGDYKNIKVYSEKPEEIIEYFQNIGIQRVHIVDLNAARDGNIKTNQKSIEKIIQSKKNLILEIGGGIRNKEVIKNYLEIGFDYLILGTIAIKRMDFVEEVLSEFHSKKFIIGVDTKNEYVYVSGWEENSNLLLYDYLNKIQEWKIDQIILTDIQKDGTLEGPNIELLQKVLNLTNLKIISSGGISSKSDIEKLKNLNHPNLIGVIIGKAFYENKINFKEIL